MISDNEFFLECGYRRDMEVMLRKIGDGREDSTATLAANQISHLKSALRELISIVEIHSEATDENFAWAELPEAKKSLGV